MKLSYYEKAKKSEVIDICMNFRDRNSSDEQPKVYIKLYQLLLTKEYHPDIYRVN